MNFSYHLLITHNTLSRISSATGRPNTTFVTSLTRRHVTLLEITVRLVDRFDNRQLCVV